MKHIGRYDTPAQAGIYLRETKGLDTFVTNMGHVPVPRTLEYDLKSEGYRLDKTQAIGGVMSGGCEPHEDDDPSDLGRSLSCIWFSKITKGHGLWLFSDGEWASVKEGDAFIFDTNKTHAVLPTSSSGRATNWTYYSTFLDEI